jgi:hypothetical protein
MTLILSGTDGLSDVDGSAATPAIRGTDANTGIFFGADIIGFAEGGVEAMRLDSAGNMGLGVTPSAWGVSFKSIDVNTYGAVSSSATAIRLFANSYGDGTNFIYKTTGAASRYDQSGGAHSWLNAASGTAGNTISFTQAMTLDASGNLALGYTASLSATSGRVDLTINGTSSSMVSFGTGGARKGYVIHDGTDLTIANESTGAMRFLNTTERMRIDSSGNLLVGTNSTLGASGVLQLLGSMDAQAVTRCSAASAGQYWRYGADSGNSFLVYSSNASGGVYIANASTSWSGRSDERLKDIIEPITDAANKVSNLRAVIGKFKTDEEGTRRSFLIAQDVQAVLPEAVSVSPRKEGEDTDYLGVAYTDVIPLLVAAIKEQQAIITQLQADVAALKGTA